MVTAWGCGLLAAISIAVGNPYERTAVPKSTSGITYAGSNTYYVVADDGSDTTYECGLHKFTINLSADGKTITGYSPSSSSAVMSQKVTLEDAYDLEAVAYDPASGHIWAANEYHSTESLANTIREYDPETGKVLSSVEVPYVITSSARTNFGLESLTISGDGLTMWTANEEATQSDGSRSSGSAGTVVRLIKYTRADIHSQFQLAAMYAYRTEKWKYRYDIGGTARRGVSDLAVLPDGTLLVLERELSFSSTSKLFCDTEIGFHLYRVDFTDATDVSKKYSLVTDKDWEPVGKTLVTEKSGEMFSSGGYGNYEGICLGPRLASGQLSLIVIADYGDSYSDGYMLPLVMSGLDVRTLNCETPALGEASLVGHNYRLMSGTARSVSVAGLNLDPPAYTNRYEPRQIHDCDWELAGLARSGSGSNVEFTVTADTTLRWTVQAQAITNASSPLLASDAFELSTEGTAAAALTGWSGAGRVVSTNYSVGTPPGPVLPREAHHRVLALADDGQDEVVRTVTTGGESVTAVESLVQLRRWTSDLTAATNLLTAAKAAVVADGDGYPQLYCRRRDGTVGWVRLQDQTYGAADWVRVALVLRAQGGEGYVQVRLNGSPCPTAAGEKSPGDGSTWGSWYRLAQGTGASRVRLLGVGALDDLVVATDGWEPERSGPTSTNGVPYAWFEKWGLATVPTNAAPGGSGYTLRESYLSGVDPYSSERLRVTEFTAGADGAISLTLNGVRETPITEYVIEGAPAVNRWSEAVNLSAEGVFTPSENTTHWERPAPATPDGLRYYRVRGVEGK